MSDDGGKLILTVGVGSPMGYVRGFRNEGGEVKPHYLKFYSAWGGFNSSLGAAGEYILMLHPDDTEVFFTAGAAAILSSCTRTASRENGAGRSSY